MGAKDVEVYPDWSILIWQSKTLIYQLIYDVDYGEEIWVTGTYIALYGHNNWL